MNLRGLTYKAFGVYRRRLWMLVVPVILWQIVSFSPLLVFTLPSIATVIKSILVSVIEQLKNIQHIAVALVCMGAIALLSIPLVAGDVVEIIRLDQAGETPTRKLAFTRARGMYKKMLSAYGAAIACGLPAFAFAGLLAYLAFTHDGMIIKQVNVSAVLLLIAAVAVLMFYLFSLAFLPYVVMRENLGGFTAYGRSARVAYLGNFKSIFPKMLVMAGILFGVGLGIKTLLQLPFADLFLAYLMNPWNTLHEPGMIFAMLLSVLAIVVTAMIMPVWYAFSYYAFEDARRAYESKKKESK